MKNNFLLSLLCILFIVSCTTTPADINPAKIKMLQEQRKILERAQVLYANKKYKEALLCLKPISKDSLFETEVFELQRKIEVDEFLKENKRETRHTIFEGIKGVDERLVYPETYGQTISITSEKIDNTIPEGPMEKLLNKKVSMNLQDADLTQIIMAMNKEGGLNLVADSALGQSDKQLTVKVEDVPLHELLSYIARNMGLDFHLGENVVWVTAGSSNDNSPKLETKIFKLKTGAIPSIGGENAIELEEALGVFLETGPPNSVYKLYRNRNLLIVKNTRDNLKIIEKLIAELDKPIKQVLIEARYLTISQNDLKELGFNLAEARQTGDRRTPIETFTNNLLRNFPASGNATLAGIIGSIEYELVIHALDEMDSTQTISSPRVTVLNNQPAMIRRGDTVRYYEEYELETVINTDGIFESQPIPVGDVQEIQTGINFEVKATIGHDGKKVMLDLNPNIVALERWETFINARLPVTSENGLQTTAVINSGQTVILGGIITETKQKEDDQIPFIGKIPLIGKLFGAESYDRSPSHLIIFVTATIIDGSGKYINIQD